MKQFSTFLLLAAFFCQSGLAQSKLSIENVRSAYVRNSGPIVANEEIKGYFVFYQSDKVDRKNNEYTLQILDENLNKVKDVQFVDSKNIQLLESSYNGSDIMFQFFDSDQKMFDYRVYGVDGKQKFSYQRPVDKKTKAYLAEYTQFNTEEAQNKSLYAIPNLGFVASIPVRDGKLYTYEVNFYGTDKKKQWTYNPEDESRVANATYLGNSDSVAVFEVLHREKLMSRKTQSYLLGLYLHNGKKAFEFETDREKFNFYPMNISTLRGGSSFMLIGPYYDKGDDMMKDKSQGLGVWAMNNQGNILATKYNSWANEISKYLKVDSRGRVEDLGYVYFHRLIQTEDGNIFAVGEGYKKAVSAVGVAATALGALGGGYGGASVMKMKVTDMVMMKFNEKFDIQAADIYEKKANSIELPGGSDFVGAPTLAHMIKYIYDGFDYSFSLTDKAHTSFMVGYTDYVRSKDYKGLTFNAISYANNNTTTDKVELKTTSSRMRIMPAKPGSVMILEYFRKDKRMDMRIEKIN